MTDEPAEDLFPIEDPAAALGEHDTTSGYVRASDIEPEEFLDSDANPDDGWKDAPEGHRDLPTNIDDTLRRKG
jgi:hypothetical protein